MWTGGWLVLLSYLIALYSAATDLCCLVTGSLDKTNPTIVSLPGGGGLSCCRASPGSSSQVI